MTNDTLKDLKLAWLDAEEKAVALSNERDDALRAVRAEYNDEVTALAAAAAAAQKVYLDHDAASGLLDRPDGAVVAKALGLQDAAANLGMVFDDEE